MKKINLIFILAFLAVQVGWSQYSGAPYGLGIRGVGVNYAQPISGDFLEEDFGYGAELEYVRHLNASLNFSAPLRVHRSYLPTTANGDYKSAGTIGLDLALQLKLFKESRFIYPYVSAGLGTRLEDATDVSFDIPLGVGLNFRLSKHVYLSTRGSYNLGLTDNRDNMQLAGGFLFLLGDGENSNKPDAPKDSDGDGLTDENDLCPNEAGSLTFNGCPDTDNDGVVDGEDLCPTVAGTKETKGCPDADGDGIVDSEDKCPDQAGTADNGGCPILDADNDGVADDNDLCPNRPGTIAAQGCPDRDGDGFADMNDPCPNIAGTNGHGCPDTDGDGVTDNMDKCPDVAGNAANKGCPEVAKEDLEILDLAVEAVQFETGKAKLKASSYAVLDQIVGLMKKYPGYSLSIDGYTDSVGHRADNQQLSDDRAGACFEYLLDKGISSKRMSYRGHGETNQFGDNKIASGRAKNRRVVFNLYIR